LLIIEFILKELVDIGSPGQMLYMSLVPNYVLCNRKSIHHERISFDLKNETAIGKHVDSVSAIVRKLKKKCVFFYLLDLYIHILTMPISRNNFTHTIVIVHTHSDDTTGDLFYTSNSDQEKTALGVQIEPVSSPPKTQVLFQKTNKF
jgi:hypothetical protein